MNYEVVLYKLNKELIAFKRRIVEYYSRKLVPGEYRKGIRICTVRAVKLFIKYTYEVVNPDKEYIVNTILRSMIMNEAMQLINSVCRRYQINVDNDYVTMDIYI